VTQLPDFARELTTWNPVFYLIDGFRYGVTGHADGALSIGIAIVVGVNLVLWAVCHLAFRTGYRLKA
jgi:ABC-2 type transport system permease protein